jgi:fructokinase
MAVILIAGEALIDFFPTQREELGFLGKPGGSPYNVAIGLGRLGVPVGFLGAISTDLFGVHLLRHLEANNVETNFVVRTKHPTALAFVFGAGENPHFYFYGDATADTQLSLENLPKELPTSIRALHFGSLSMVRAPSNTAFIKLMEQECSQRLISFDPNIRPQFVSLEKYRQDFARWLPMIDVLKLSLADLQLLVPNPSQETMKQWLRQGPKLIVITLGRLGACAYTAEHYIEIPGQSIKIVDTVGAGDAFMAALLAGLYYTNHLDKQAVVHLDKELLQKLLVFAIKAAEITCQRQGADPPFLRELSEHCFWN